MQVFVVKYCILASQRTSTYFDAQIVGKQVILKTICKKNSCCKVCQNPCHLRDRKIVHIMKSRSVLLHSENHKTFCVIFIRANKISTAWTHKSAENEFQYTKAIRCGNIDAASKTAAEDTLSEKRKLKRTSNETPLRRQCWKPLKVWTNM